MYILQRTTDNKYFKNLDYHSCHFNTELWTDDINEVKPFRSIQGAKSSRGYSLSVRNPEWISYRDTPNVKMFLPHPLGKGLYRIIKVEISKSLKSLDRSEKP